MATGHPIITSFEPGEDWFFDYEKRRMIEGVELLPPHAHPLEWLCSSGRAAYRYGLFSSEGQFTITVKLLAAF